MSTSHATDVNVSSQRISQLTSPDAVAAFFTELGYDTERRSELSPEAIGLSGDAAAAIQRIEVLCEDDEGFLRVAFVKLRSLTAKSRNDLTRVLGRTNIEHLLVLASDFATIEFVLIHKQRRESRAPGRAASIQPIPLMIALDRKAPSTKELRAIRRFTWTKRDGLEQYDKLRSVFEAAAFTEEYFCNRALFADHFLMTRLRDDAAWQENPAAAFQGVRDLMRDPAKRWLEKGEQIVRDELFEPLFHLLGFQAKAAKPAKDGRNNPDYHLTGPNGAKTVAFTYAWDRWLDGPDFQLDADTPDENPGACVVTALEEGQADWIIVTNGRQWRLYSRAAHSRATNFYEVDLAEALVASGDTDPNESFRYWWLFFRAQAFAPTEDDADRCWLDAIAEGSRDYAKDLGKRLKDRVFVTIFPHLAQGFLHDRKQRLGLKRKPTADELRDVYEATLTLLYRLLFLLYAEARDLLPIREGPYREASLRKIKEEIADKGGIAESEVADRLRKAYSPKEHALYDRLGRLCRAMDKGDASLNVPIYNGGLFITDPAQGDDRSREQRIARFLAEHKVPDQHLALAIDRLARDPDDRTHSLVSIDYKSLAVRHLGSIYEGLLEFKLKVADEDLATKTEKKKEKYIPLRDARPSRGRAPAAVVRKGEVYLSNDKAERKASGSYYTPDPIVEYIVEHTVGPVLDEKLEALRPELRKVRKTFDNELQKLRVPPVPKAIREGRYSEREFAAEKTYAAHKDLVERLFDFRTLDPAMGSGHFLVDAVDFITDRMLAFLNQFPVNPVTFMLNRTRRNILDALGEQGVAVDPDKLTEVNLLKRHVLKRCIYGVDLNPMAVELAKVSLWLDAFTIGAPLSFLDHHLRCGNSLIGATFEDLEAVIKGQLFSIDYEPLLRAIRHVLLVNKMADATSAEVKQSQNEYAEARDQLSGYKVVLDLIVAEHFGEPDAPELVSLGSDLDLSSRSKFTQSLRDLNDRALLERVERLAQQPDSRFFHWEIEFPEVFFGFADKDERQLRHKNRIATASAGFDAVVGNPPYDEVSTANGALPAIKAYFDLAATYGPFKSGRVNLYRLFVVRSVLTLMAADTTLGMIVPLGIFSDSFSYGTRKLMLSKGSLIRIDAFPQKDDPRQRVFEDAKVPTATFLYSNASTEESGTQLVHPANEITDSASSLTFTNSDIEAYFPTTLCIPLISDQELDIIKSRMSEHVGPRLVDVATVFAGEICDNAGSKHLLSDDDVGPVVLRGAHIDRYRLRDESRQGANRYLREAQYLAERGMADRATHHKLTRIVFQKGAALDSWRRMVACIVAPGHFCFDTTGYILPVDEKDLLNLLGVFNSALWEWRFRCTSQTNHINAYDIEPIVIPDVLLGDQPSASELRKLVAEASESNDGVLRADSHRRGIDDAIDNKIDAIVFEAYGITSAEKQIILDRVWYQ